MTASACVDHHIIDHCRRWSRTGRDGACLDRCRMRRRDQQQQPSNINLADSIGFGTPIVSPGLLDQYQPRRRSAPAAPAATTKSP